MPILYSTSLKPKEIPKGEKTAKKLIRQKFSRPSPSPSSLIDHNLRLKEDPYHRKMIVNTHPKTAIVRNSNRSSDGATLSPRRRNV